MLNYTRRLSGAKRITDEDASTVAFGSWSAGAFKDTCDAFNSSGSVNPAGAASGQSCNS